MFFQSYTAAASVDAIFQYFFAPFRFKAPKDKGPKNVRVFMNQPTTIDFDKADGMTSTQVYLQKEWKA